MWCAWPRPDSLLALAALCTSQDPNRPALLGYLEPYQLYQSLYFNYPYNPDHLEWLKNSTNSQNFFEVSVLKIVSCSYEIQTYQCVYWKCVPTTLIHKALTQTTKSVVHRVICPYIYSLFWTSHVIDFIHWYHPVTTISWITFNTDIWKPNMGVDMLVQWAKLAFGTPMSLFEVSVWVLAVLF